MKNYNLDYLPTEERDALKLRIHLSVKSISEQRNIFLIRRFIQYAAVIAVFLTFGFVYVLQTEDVSDFSQSVAEIPKEFLERGDVRLLVNGAEEVSISEVSSSITYTSQGAITVGSESKSTIVNDNLSISKNNEILVPYGKRTKLTLSDGTKVWLNSGSRMVYPAVFNDNSREVYLEGEAIFEVSHNAEKPFYVGTKDYRVKVLGTVFNISSYQEDSHSITALESGKVEIQYKNNGLFGSSSEKITKGTLAVYERKSKTLQTRKADIQPFMSWREGYLNVKNQNLDVILKRLARYYKVDIEVGGGSNLEDTTFSGYLDLKGNIEQVLDIVSTTSKIDYYRLSEENILIKYN